MRKTHNNKSESTTLTHNHNGRGRPRLSVSHLRSASALRSALKRDLLTLEQANAATVTALNKCGDLLGSLFGLSPAPAGLTHETHRLGLAADIIGLLHLSATKVHSVIETRRPDRSAGRSDEVLAKARAKRWKKRSGKSGKGKEVA